MKQPVDEMITCWIDQYMKWLVDEMACWGNDQLMIWALKWKVDEVARWCNSPRQNDQLPRQLVWQKTQRLMKHSVKWVI